MARKGMQYKNDASCINNTRGMARRAKRHSAHSDRQSARTDIGERIADMEDTAEVESTLPTDIVWGEDDELDMFDYDYDDTRNDFEDMAKEYDLHRRFR